MQFSVVQSCSDLSDQNLHKSFAAQKCLPNLKYETSQYFVLLSFKSVYFALKHFLSFFLSFFLREEIVVPHDGAKLKTIF